MNVLIAGGGIGGITAALCLAEQGIRVQIFEQASPSEVGLVFSFRRIALEYCTSRPSADLLSHGFLPEGIQFRD